ncbi:hypothetical protein D1093_09625 [Bartonella kosoyi]|uniref:Uncharacterized protein n=1 Tax=Bartonella kosoyi TaxID=2133959 RepID=A0A5B9D041_9HYPH|nr:hypothetical protein [Bartonella kosoyi]QEE09807.1 hypothetical protein D1093_09625 [Bartonella kosoyi]
MTFQVNNGLCRCFSLVDGFGVCFEVLYWFFDRVLLVEVGVGLMHNKRGLLRLFGDWDYGVCRIAGGVRGESVADIVVDGGWLSWGWWYGVWIFRSGS